MASKNKRGYRGRAIVPRPGGPMRDRKREASRRAARGWKCRDHTEWPDSDPYGWE